MIIKLLDDENGGESPRARERVRARSPNPIAAQMIAPVTKIRHTRDTFFVDSGTARDGTHIRTYRQTV